MPFCCSHRLALTTYLAAILLPATPALGQLELIPDTAPDRNLGTQIIQNVAPGVDLVTGGRRPQNGQNLFHSFQEFNVRENRGVYFENPTGVQNILTRVTGNGSSNILGTLGVAGSANLFFMNPRGIAFGPNAQLQISGSFFATTANSFKFADGSEFSATNPQAPPLLTINLMPGLQTGNIPLGSTITNRSNLIGGQDLMLHADRLELQGQLWASRNLILQAQDIVKIRDSVTAPFRAVAGGSLLVQGNQSVDIFALNHPASELVSGGTMTLRSANPIKGDAHYWSGSTFQIEQLNGELGTLVSPYDPIVRSQGDVTFQNYRGTSLHILAGGRVTAGAVIITGNDTIGNTINPTATPALATVPLSNGSQATINGNARPTLDIRAGMEPAAIGAPLGTSGYNPPFLFGFGSLFPGTSFIFPQSPPPSNNLTTTGSDIAIDIISINQPNGQVLLTNQFRPNQSLPNGSITINSNSGLGVSGIYANSNVGRGGDVTLDARGNINLNGNVGTFSASALSNGGNVTLLAGGDITLAPNTLVSAVGALGGNITLQSGGTLSFQGGSIASNSNTPGLGIGGAINVAVRSLILRGGARLGTITSGGATGGNVTVNALEKVEITEAGFTRDSLLFSQTTGRGKSGDVTITTPQLLLGNGGQVAVNTNGPGAGGNLTIRNANLIDIRGRNPSGTSASSLGTNALRSGNAGTMTVETNQLRVLNGAQLGGGTLGSGNGGRISITASDVQIAGEGTGVFATAVAGSSGNAGELEIRTDRLLVEADGNILANTQSRGQGGAITITANQVMVQSGGEIFAGTSSSGNGGQITINARDIVEVNGESANQRSLISTRSAPEATGSAGVLSITTNNLTLRDGGQIDSATFGAGQGGDVLITAFDSIAAIGSTSGQSASGLFVGANGQSANAGSGGTLKINTRQLLIQDGAQFNAGTIGSGEGGSLDIRASESIRLVGGNPDVVSGIFSGSTSTGNAGGMQISTPLLTLQGNSGLSVATRGSGRAGSIVANTDNLTLNGGATISTNTSNRGQAGDLTLNVTNQLILTGSKTGLFASTTPGSTGNGGSITIYPKTVLIQDAATIAVSSQGSGIGGSIFLQADRLELRDRGSINAETASAQGGNITLNVQDLTLLRRTSLISATAGTAQAAGDGGNITLNSDFIVGVLGENSDIIANAFTGRGGSINITTNAIYGLLSQSQRTPLSDITASSEFGLSGTISITTLDLDPNRGLVVLPTNLTDPSRQISQACTLGSSTTARRNQFVVTGRGGLPTSPTAVMTGERPLVDLVSLVPTSSDQAPVSIAHPAVPSEVPSGEVPLPIVEAQAWAKAGNGEIYLIADAATASAHLMGMTTPTCPSN